LKQIFRRPAGQAAKPHMLFPIRGIMMGLRREPGRFRKPASLPVGASDLGSRGQHKNCVLGGGGPVRGENKKTNGAEGGEWERSVGMSNFTGELCRVSNGHQKKNGGAMFVMICDKKAPIQMKVGLSKRRENKGSFWSGMATVLTPGKTKQKNKLGTGPGGRAHSTFGGRARSRVHLPGGSRRTRKNWAYGKAGARIWGNKNVAFLIFFRALSFRSPKKQGGNLLPAPKGIRL